MKREYGKGKTARLPGARVSEKFQEDLKEWATLLQVSQAQLLENAFYHFTTSEQCFDRCPSCGKPAITAFHISVVNLENVKCPSCGHVFDIG